jgi:hypothetical protein
VDALYLTIIGVLLGAMFTMIAAWWKSREEARGWKVSYEREKERSDLNDQTNRDAQQAVAIGNRVAEALHDLQRQQGTPLGGGQP